MSDRNPDTKTEFEYRMWMLVNIEILNEFNAIQMNYIS